MNFKKQNPSMQSQVQLKEKIVHLGLGAFHRAHQAAIIDEINKSTEGSDWGICAMSISGSESGSNLINLMKNQNHSFSLIVRSEQENKLLTINSIINTLSLRDDGNEALLKKISDPLVQILTLTITEKGYCIQPGKQTLDLSNPLIQKDIQEPNSATSILGLLYRALKLREKNQSPPLTIISCDNIPQNGDVLQQILIEFTTIIDRPFVDYINTNISFPNSMVDRIVPAVTSEALQLSHEIIGKTDPCSVITEPFIQWVIENKFIGEYPNFKNSKNVVIVENITPYEQMKLRMLNGSHSFLAYLGSLSNYDLISECMADDLFYQSVMVFMLQEQAPTLPPTEINLTEYADQLIKRYKNKAIKHSTSQIAMDGSQKIPQRFLDSIRWHMDHQSNCPLLFLALAGWMHYVHQNIKSLQDPLKKELENAIHLNELSLDNYSLSLINIPQIFPADLTNNTDFTDRLTDAFTLIDSFGAKAAIRKTLQQFYNN